MVSNYHSVEMVQTPENYMQHSERGIIVILILMYGDIQSCLTCRKVLEIPPGSGKKVVKMLESP